jgi:Zn-dependent M28 family amino/carboxypeptidase
VVVGAHYDHLGYGGAGGSLAGLKRMAIHHGADDNGSGTTTVMELARRFAAMPGRQGRRLLFMTFSGEELGLLGSAHYCRAPLLPLADTVSMLNLDMVGRLRPDKDSGLDKLLSEGSGTAAAFKDLVDKLAKKHAFKMVNKPSGFGPSDHASFCAKKVPVLFFWTDYHADYHRPSDTSDKINVPGMRRIADLGEDVLLYLTTVEKRPAFVEVKGGGPLSPSMNGPRLGIRPSYGDDGDGVLLEGVQGGGPAAQAGLKEGDRIIEMAGKPVKNLQTYMEVMSGQKKGGTLEVRIIRDGKKMTVKVKLE